MAGMDKDPKNPNAWWAIPPPSLRACFPKNLSRSQKIRIYLILAALAIMCAVEFFYLSKLMK
jgi:hypothetical protein